MLLRSANLILDDLQIYLLSGNVLLAAWDGPESSSEPIDISIDGKPAERRRATLRLPTLTGAVRTIVTFRYGALAGDATVAVKHGNRDLQSRLLIDTPANVTPLTAALSDGSQARLMNYLMGLCRGTFALADVEAFAFFCSRALQSCGSKPVLQFRPAAHLAAGNIVYTATGTVDLGNALKMFAGVEKRVAELPFLPVGESLDERETRLVLVAPRWATASGVTVILVGDSGFAMAEFLPAMGIPSVARLAEQKKLSRSERHYILRCLGEMANDEAAATARALQILAPEPARELLNPKSPVNAKLDFTISCGDAGVFMRGWIRDRNGLVHDAELLSPFGTQALKDHWRRLPRLDLHKLPGFDAEREWRPGFVALAPIHEPVPVLQHGLRLLTASGALTTISPTRVLSDMDARNAVLSAVAPNDLSAELLAKIVAPATTELHRRVMAAQAAPEVIEIGAVNPNPAVSFIIPLYRNLSFLRLQISAFAVDPEICRDVELIYVLDSPEQKGEVEHLLRGLHVVTGLSFRLVVMSANFGYAAANNTGARAAHGHALMLMNSDVIPIAANWLRSLRTAFRLGLNGCPVGAVGPKLIFDDGSLQHAGLTFERDIDGRWYNTHFYKGYPRDWPAACVSRSVPGVTGAAMFMPRAVYEEIGGFSEDYVVGDYEDSDLCLKLRSRGYDIRYEPRAELYHFERRSITMHAGYVNTAASAYNRALHSGRWSDLMSELTAGEELSAEEPFIDPESDLLEAVASGGGR